jgi:hypothetical protein
MKETEQKELRLRAALQEILEWDERSMYERCPNCWNDTCSKEKRCKDVPRSHIGKVAASALADSE